MLKHDKNIEKVTKMGFYTFFLKFSVFRLTGEI